MGTENTLNYRILNCLLPEEVFIRALPKLSYSLESIFKDFIKDKSTASKYKIEKNVLLDSLKSGSIFSMLTIETCCKINFIIKTHHVYFIVTINKDNSDFKTNSNKFLLEESLSNIEKREKYGSKKFTCVTK